MSLLTKPEDLKGNRYFRGMVYGQPGIGKSTLAVSAPTPVVIDADNGLHRVAPHLRVPSLQVSNYEEVLAFINSDEIEPFETIVIDTAGKIIDYIEKWIAENNPKLASSTGLTLQGYGQRKATFTKLVKTINSKGKNVLFVAHEAEDKDNDTKIVRPDVTKSALADILKDLDFLGYMEAQGSKRTISFAPTSKYYAKNSLELTDVIIIPDTKEGNNFISEKIVKMNNERMKEQANLRAKYNEVISAAQSIVLNNANLNNAIEALKELETIWDSKIQIRHFLNNYAKENNWVWDKEEKQYKREEQPAASTTDELFEQMKAESGTEPEPETKTAKAKK